MNTETATQTDPAIWTTLFSERLITASTGVVHAGDRGMTLCGTRVALRRSADQSIRPTCTRCGA